MRGEYQFLYSTKFNREYKKLQKTLGTEIKEAIELLRFEENHKKLKLHKLAGGLERFYALSVNYKYRIIIKFIGNEIHFLEVGNHDIYK